MAVIIQFFLTTALVLGVSDGLFNVVLNSVAIVFVLHLDNYVDIDLPDRNFFRLATSEQLKRHAARSRAVSFRRRASRMVTHTGGTTRARYLIRSCAPRAGARAETCICTAW